jgi:AraC-like DNA-binding protein
MSRRQFSRAFRTQTAPRPRVVERLRADMARGRIESTTEPIERTAKAVGFGDAENMRRAFIRIYGQPPQSIRRAIRNWDGELRATIPVKFSAEAPPRVEYSLTPLGRSVEPVIRSLRTWAMRIWKFAELHLALSTASRLWRDA